MERRPPIGALFYAFSTDFSGFMADVVVGKKLLSQGFRILDCGGDLWLYQAALRQGIAALRGARPALAS